MHKLGVRFCLVWILTIWTTIGYSQKKSEFTAVLKEALALVPANLKKADSLAVMLQSKIDMATGVHDSIQAKVYFLRGYINFYKGYFYLAEKYFNDAVKKSFGWKGELLREYCYNNLGIIHFKKDALTKAYDAYDNSLRLAEKRKDSLSIIQTLINISLLEDRRANNARALELGQFILDYTNRNRDSLNMALAHQNLSIFYNSQRKMDKVEYHDNAALEIYRMIGSTFERCALELNMAFSFTQKGQYNKAEKLVDAALSTILEKEYQSLLVQVYLIKAIIHMDGRQSYGLSEEFLRKAEALCKEIGKEENLVEIYKNWIRLAMKRGDQALFDTCVEKFSTQQGKVFRMDSDAAYEQIATLYGLDKAREKQVRLEAAVVLRNRQLFFVIMLLIVAAFGIGVIAQQNRRLREAYRVMFRLNVENEREKAKEVEHAEKNHTSTSEREEDNKEAIASFKIYKELMKLLEQEKLYLDPDLTIQLLCKRLGTNQNYLSKSIRENAGMNFNGLINNLRVKEARRLILEKPLDCSLKEISEQSGFNNRVSFHRRFKEITGFTPSLFKGMAANPDFQQHNLDEENDLGTES